ncbi:helix-turn-helix transcriptional regulator [Streptomyces scabiei]|uniref:helix-turn-helix domain-containing protein n=1 Tax=Streptomyces scabiei TaxID=1930 RepID=UPI001BB4D7AD|nr:helix-turn-helix transcriptional regulator [Streptomyces sp. LBUM 1482]
MVAFQSHSCKSSPMSTEATPVRSRPPIRAVRAARGLTLRAVAQRSGIDPGHLSKVERGEKQLSIEALHRLAQVLELRELATLLQPYVMCREVMAVPEVQSGAVATGDDEATRGPAGSPLSSKPIPTAK